MLLELELLLEEQDISKDQVCIVGSSVMTIHGLRENHDIDFVMVSGYRKRYGSALYKLNESIDLVTENWAHSLKRATIKDDDLITSNRYFTLFHGFKFASLQLLIERKQWQGREKDKRDVLLMEKYVSNQTSQQKRVKLQ